jgi:hypothetical protein
MFWWPVSSAALGSHRNSTVTKVRNSNHDLWRCYSTWEYARHGPPVCTHNWMAWWRSTWGRSFQHIGETGTREYLSFSWPLEDQLTSIGESYICPVTCSWGSLLQGAAQTDYMTRPCGMAAWCPLLCVSTFERDQWQDEVPQWPPSQFHGIPRRQSLVVLPNLDQKKVAQAPALLGRPYKMVTNISDIVYMIQQHLNVKMMVVHVDRLIPYLGATQDG